MPRGPKSEAGCAAAHIMGMGPQIAAAIAQAEGHPQKAALLQSMAGMVEQLAAMTAAQAPPAANASPTPVAPTCAQPAPTLAAPQAASLDGPQLGLRTSTKAATLEAASNRANAIIERSNQEQRKEEREKQFASRREHDGLVGLSEAEARSQQASA